MTDSPRRLLKRKLARRALVTGIVADFPSPDMTEYLGSLGFDYVFIDCEHAGPDFETVVAMARAARAGGIATLLRPWSTEPGLVRRYVDCGIDGLIAPDTESRADIDRIVEIVRAADPPGMEGFIFAPLVESATGVAHADDILSAPAVDVVMVGPSDLAISLGEPRRGVAPQARAMVFDVLGKARAAGKSAGLPAGRYGAETAWDGGANLLILSVKEALKRGAAEAIDSYRSLEADAHSGE